MRRIIRLHSMPLIIALTLSLCILSLTAVPVLAGYFYWCVDEIEKEKTNWCWAATMQSITNWHDDDYTQEEIYVFVKGDEEYRNEGASFAEMEPAYNDMGYDTNYVEGVMDWDDMLDEVYYNDYPFHIAWDKMGTHASVLCGFNREDPPDCTPLGYYIMDPDIPKIVYKEKDYFDSVWLGSLTVHP